MSPAAHRLAVLALYGVAAVGTFVLIVLVSVMAEGPVRAVSDFAAGFGALGSLALVALAIGCPVVLVLWDRRRIERQRLAQGIIDVPQQRDTRPPRGVVRWVMAPLWIAVAILFVVCVVVAIRDLA